MSGRNFRELLEGRWDTGTLVCVGLDSDFEKIPRTAWGRDYEERILSFNRSIVDATYDLVCAYKPNIAFYEAHGDDGWSALRQTIWYIHKAAKDVPVILDAKRADIGNTNTGYVQAAFEYLKVDAITVHPYLGREALTPFLEQEDKGIIVLCRTSNPGAGEFQDALVDGVPLYHVVAERVATRWNERGNCALVVGATYPKELGEVRQIVGDMPILVPGIGTQGGDVQATVTAGKDSRGRGMIVNSSRSIIFASDGEDFPEAARRETIKLYDLIKQYC